MNVAKIGAINIATPQKIAFGKHSVEYSQTPDSSKRNEIIAGGAAVTALIVGGILYAKGKSTKAAQNIKNGANKLATELSSDSKHIAGLAVVKSMENHIQEVEKRSAEFKSFYEEAVKA